ncbi:RQC-minor-1 family DNA-binding protein [Robertmurraya massiliosenegalensis]|uniref:RQC-minor-1 family DNA-binding protein n=1 Tax=Robertmurraya massiliosenegalensis TaxID=1287657 RepID=UPI000684D933|nr:RQC-minor-1 family DNA-binding protein [Robertmurraya massiliosenegalensis]
MNSSINRLTDEEIKVILRAADPIIAKGGRTLLAKILKGSREKKVLQLELDSCPVYGYFKDDKLDGIMQKIDWMINFDFLDIEYYGKLPMIIFTERGWHIESDQIAEELFNEWKEWINKGKQNPDMSYLKDRNREMVLLLLEKIKASENQTFIPYLELWEKVDYKKVRDEIRRTILVLNGEMPFDDSIIKERAKSIREALKGLEMQDLLLKCWVCGERFTFTIDEQRYYKSKGFKNPKRCKACRKEKDDVFFY